MKDQNNIPKIYRNQGINKARMELESEFRTQYDIACENTHFEWQREFKIAFENVCEALYQLDKLLK